MLCIPLWLGATPPPPPAILGCLALPLTFPTLSDLITVANGGGRSGAGGSGGGGHQELEPSCVAACAPTSTVHAHPSTVLSSLVVPSASSGSTEGGDPTAADTATSRCSPRLETPPGFPPWTSSPPLQPIAADFRGLGVVGGGDAWGAGSGGAASGGARCPLVGGVGGIGAGGAVVGGAGAGGAGSGGALQSLPRLPIFLEQPSSSLPEPTPTCTSPPLLFPPRDSPLPALARYVPLSVSLTERREPVSCAASPAPSRVTREPVVLSLPPPSSLPAIPDPVSNLAHVARLTIPCCLATLVTAPASSPAVACASVAELAGFATTCCHAYLAGLVSASLYPPSVGGELALGCDVLEDRQLELEYPPYPLSIQTRYVVPGRHHPAHWRAARRVLRFLGTAGGTAGAGSAGGTAGGAGGTAGGAGGVAGAGFASLGGPVGGVGAASPGSTAGTGCAGGTVGGAGGAAGAGGAGAASPGGPVGGAGAASPGGTAGTGGAGGTGGGAGGTAGAGGAGAASRGGSAGAGGRGGTAGGAASAGGAGCTARGAGGAASAGGAGASSPGGPVGGAGAASPRGTIGTGGAGGTAGGAAGAGGAGATSLGGTAGAGGAGGAAGSAGGVACAGGSGGVAGSAGGAASAGGAGPVGVLHHLLGLPPAATEFPVAGTTPPLLFPPADLSLPQLLLHSPLPTPAPYTEVTESLTERREPETRASTPERQETETRASVLARVRRVRHPRASAVPGTHDITVRPSSVPQRVVHPSPPASSLPGVTGPLFDLARASSLTITRFLATVVTDPTFWSPAVFALVVELVDFADAYRLDCLASLVSDPDLACPPSIRGEVALGCDVLEDIQEELECLAAAVPHLATMLLAPKGDLDALDIPTPRSYREAISGEYSSRWQTAMDAEMASWKSTCTYVDEVPPLGANIVDGMWIFIVKRPSGSSPAFKARYVARGFSQRQGVHYFHTFSPTPKMTALRVLLHVAALRDYELHSLAFSTAFFLRRPVYDLRQAHREWHDTLRTTLAALGFAPYSADPSLFLRTDTTLPPFYVLVRSYKRDTPALTLVLRRFGFQYSSPQPTPLPTSHSLSAPLLDESVKPSDPYPELVGCLMYLMTCTRPDLTYPLSLLARYVAPGRHRKMHWYAAKRVLHYLCSTSGMGLVLGGQGLVVLIGHSDTSWADDQATQRSSLCYTFSLSSRSVSWRSTRSSSVLSSSYEAEIYAVAMAAQELRWLTYLLTVLGERSRSPPVLYVDNKAMLALCREQRLEHRTKHIALHYFLALELQQRGQLRLSYVASRVNTADVFTKALWSGDLKRFCTALGLLPVLPHLCWAEKS
ncbi:unnamed protein product [Closterium sp. NIES-53]